MTTHGFPPGYFVIKSVASDRVLDITRDEIEDGTEPGSTITALRNPNSNNQVFFIDTSGALCSRSSGHAIDVEDGKLVLRHRRPISHPYPNAYSHPLPRFAYFQTTGEITVTFESDPTYPLPDRQPSEAWQNKCYLLTSVPLRKPRSIIGDASEFLSTAIAAPLTGLSNMFSIGGANPAGHADEHIAARPEEVFDGEIDLSEHEVVEEERGLEGEVDDSPELGRKVVVVGIAPNEREGAVSLANARRRWTVHPLRRLNARTSHSVTS